MIAPTLPRTPVTFLWVGWLCVFFLLSAPHQARAQGQASTPVPDSAIAGQAETDRLAPKHLREPWGRPQWATLYSAVLPGAGQVYNGQWWKVPIIYVGGGLLGYFIVDNNRSYQRYLQAVKIRQDGNPETIDAFEGRLTTPQLLARRNLYRRNRDLTIILSLATYLLNVADAHVFAHLRDFEVGDDLSLRIEPALLPGGMSVLPQSGLTGGTTWVPGGSLTLTFGGRPGPTRRPYQLEERYR